uniref:Flap endonuclease 1 n=1 Tax=Romanomermis culicivorax TaxID=13658 RepID=A0A915K2N7_ROMCU
MSIYQFLIAIRQDGATLVNESGDTTSHLSGMFYRTIRMIENGIKPLYVFDGKPPEMKFEEPRYANRDKIVVLNLVVGTAQKSKDNVKWKKLLLNSRREKREEAEKEMAKAVEAGDTELIDKFSRRLVKVLPEHNNDCKKLLTLMGVPYVEAPCEAEAQCAALVKAGKVFATATEDMDALTFGSSVLLRHLTFSEAKKMPIKEFYLDKVLQGLELNHGEFIDLCILLGCDYCPSIRGIGPKKALELIQKHRSLEKILENLDKTKYPVPEHWPYQQCRKLFVEPDTADCENLEVRNDLKSILQQLGTF